MQILTTILAAFVSATAVNALIGTWYHDTGCTQKGEDFNNQLNVFSLDDKRAKGVIATQKIITWTDYGCTTTPGTFEKGQCGHYRNGAEVRCLMKAVY